MDINEDTVATYQTPEGIKLNLSLAGPVSRGVAWAIDLAIRIACYIALAVIAGILGGVGGGLTLIGLFLIEWFYPVFFEVWRGATPGKQLIGLQVVHDDGTPVALAASLIRNLIRCVDLLPLFNMTGLVTMFFSTRFKRLGDIAAGTVVVYVRDDNRRFVIPDYPSAPPPVPLKLEEQRTILDFCERAGRLSDERRHELAGLLDELTGGMKPENRLLAYGNWFQKGKTGNEPESI